MENPNIQLFKPVFQIDECLAEIRECLEKGWTGLGYKTVEFENAWCAYTGHESAHFLSSATAGLHLAVKILKEENGWRDGDEIISTPLTFVSTNHAVLYENLKVVFADVDDHLCLDPVSIKSKITPRTRAVIFVGMGGNTGKWQEVVDLCHENGIKVILDAAHMAGTRLNGRPVGPEADVVVYSFQAVKNLPTADSGMICFADKELDKVARKQSWLGISKDTYARTHEQAAYKWMYTVDHLGYKYHGNSIMAAIALVQLRYLDRDNSYRRQIAKWYDDVFADAGIRAIPVAAGCESSRHLYQIVVDRREEFIMALNSLGIYPGVHYRSNIDYSMYSSNGQDCVRAAWYSDRILTLPIHMELSKADVDYVARNVVELYQDRSVSIPDWSSHLDSD